MRASLSDRFATELQQIVKIAEDDRGNSKALAGGALGGAAGLAAAYQIMKGRNKALAEASRLEKLYRFVPVGRMLPHRSAQSLRQDADLAGNLAIQVPLVGAGMGGAIGSALPTSRGKEKKAYKNIGRSEGLLKLAGFLDFFRKAKPATASEQGAALLDKVKGALPKKSATPKLSPVDQLQQWKTAPSPEQQLALMKAKLSKTAAVSAYLTKFKKVRQGVTLPPPMSRMSAG